MTFPFPYILKRSTRAKNVRLQITPRSGLELIVPQKFSEKSALQFLEKNIAWVEKNKHHLKETVEPVIPFSIPEKIYLPAIEKTWEIIHDFFSHQRISLKVYQEKIFLTGKQMAKRTFKKLLLKFLKETAAVYLKEKLYFLSEEYGF